MNSLSQQLSQSITNARPLLLNLKEQKYRFKSTPSSWSKIEILGHLIDSAINNQRRFVIACIQDNLIFDGYEQEKWVALQAYQERDWNELVNNWYTINNHIANNIDLIPLDILRKTHNDHSLDKVAWKTIQKDELATLEFFISDYISHMSHHLRQILS